MSGQFPAVSELVPELIPFSDWVKRYDLALHKQQSSTSKSQELLALVMTEVQRDPP